ncbi:acylphosphatase [Methylotuvimicrobium buryatense]|uniref:Acylphosphatase n=1 Tax=Methylotuvimicrobium buryatense TaxID=95641 RepID=A0A4P9UT37_METBY|nr:acylphosphatase [Methylotuvimicrobium buryatense]QCW83713.1 acylphosphatase [Methylotuvimicrobium buryatense]
MTKQVRILVSGRVQGVYFRAFTQKEARKHQLSGFAKNLQDGRVEVVAAGPKEAVEKLIRWCHKGPITARVDHIETEELTGIDIPAGFEIR